MFCLIFVVLQNYRYFLSQNLDLTTMTHHLEDEHQIYYCQQNGYWDGTLIRIQIAGTDQNTATDQTCQLKIYNK